jgi:Protein of unknown function (DUF3300)
MIRTFGKQLISIALSVLIGVTAIPFEAGAQQSAPSSGAGYSESPAPLAALELQQLAAPIALYPDALVAQILGAATFPDQVVSAHDWLQHNKNLTGTSLTQAVDAQPWDLSVKALTQFPSVLENLGKNPSWTSALGEAYHLQAADVMSAVQGLRARFVMLRRTLRPSTSLRSTMVPRSNTRRSLSATRASTTACTGSRRKAKLQAR